MSILKIYKSNFSRLQISSIEKKPKEKSPLKFQKLLEERKHQIKIYEFHSHEGKKIIFQASTKKIEHTLYSTATIKEIASSVFLLAS